MREVGCHRGSSLCNATSCHSVGSSFVNWLRVETQQVAINPHQGNSRQLQPEDIELPDFMCQTGPQGLFIFVTPRDLWWISHSHRHPWLSMVIGQNLPASEARTSGLYCYGVTVARRGLMQWNKIKLQTNKCSQQEKTNGVKEVLINVIFFKCYFLKSCNVSLIWLL